MSISALITDEGFLRIQEVTRQCAKAIGLKVDSFSITATHTGTYRFFLRSSHKNSPYPVETVMTSRSCPKTSDEYAALAWLGDSIERVLTTAEKVHRRNHFESLTTV